MKLKSRDWFGWWQKCHQRVNFFKIYHLKINQCISWDQWTNWLHLEKIWEVFIAVVKNVSVLPRLTSIRVRKSGNQANTQRLPHFFLIAVHNDAIIPRPVTQIESRFFGLFSTQSKAKVVTCECARVFFMYIVARILDQTQLWHFRLFFINCKLQSNNYT